jgi:hypothetical protein
MRIRVIRDTLRLNPPPELFLEKSLDDLAFVAGALELLVKSILENISQYSGNGELEYISDTEWQFNQVLTEFSLETSPFSANAYPETMHKITVMRASSEARRKIIEENQPLEVVQSEPVVTSAELNGLLGGV